MPLPSSAIPNYNRSNIRVTTHSTSLHTEWKSSTKLTLQKDASNLRKMESANVNPKCGKPQSSIAIDPLKRIRVKELLHLSTGSALKERIEQKCAWMCWKYSRNHRRSSRERAEDIEERHLWELWGAHLRIVRSLWRYLRWEVEMAEPSSGSFGLWWRLRKSEDNVSRSAFQLGPFFLHVAGQVAKNLCKALFQEES